MYDIAVIGAGPAGCAAALYCARFGRSVIVFEASAAGGQMSEAAKIENYPGVEPIGGDSLAQIMRMQAQRSGAEFSAQGVVAVSPNEKTLETRQGRYRARCIIIATGARAKTLGLEKEAELTGRGVSYCAACDGALYRGKTVGVVGGGASAVTEALHLSHLCENVHLFHRRAELRAPQSEQAAMRLRPNIRFHPAGTVSELLGENRLCGVRVKDMRTGALFSQTLDGLFIAIGRTPESTIFPLKKDEDGFIRTDEHMRTELDGVFAAGDVRAKSVRQITTAVSDGTVAAFSAEAYLTQRCAARH